MGRSGRPPLRAVLLDIDGTLVDSNRQHAMAYVDAARELGVELRLEDVLVKIGKGGDKVVPELIGHAHDEGRGRELSALKKKIFAARYLPSLCPTPGARALLLRLREDGIGRVVATSAGGEELAGLLEQAGLSDLIDAATSSDDAEHSKPDPDIVVAAAQRTGAPRETLVMLGDTPYDISAARRAGIDVVALRCGGWDDDALRGALAIYDDPRALLERYADSPLAGAD